MYKESGKRFIDTAVYYTWDATVSEADLRHGFRLSATIYSFECLESEGENPEICYCAGSSVRFEERNYPSNMEHFNRHSIYDSDP